MGDLGFLEFRFVVSGLLGNPSLASGISLGPSAALLIRHKLGGGSLLSRRVQSKFPK